MTLIDKNLPGADVHNAQQLVNLLNMQHILAGGFQTEYGLYLIQQILDANNNTFMDHYEGATEILEAMSKINWRKQNKNTGYKNDGILFENMYEIATKIVKKHPGYAQKLKDIMKTLEKNQEPNNEWPEYADDFIRAVELADQGTKYSQMKNAQKRN